MRVGNACWFYMLNIFRIVKCSVVKNWNRAIYSWLLFRILFQNTLFFVFTSVSKEQMIKNYNSTRFIFKKYNKWKLLIKATIIT